MYGGCGAVAGALGSLSLDTIDSVPWQGMLSTGLIGAAAAIITQATGQGIPTAIRRGAQRKTTRP